MDHVRIDEGVKRGPRQKPKLPAQARTLSVALRPLHNIAPEERKRIAETVLDRYIHGEQVAAIAPEFNTSDVTIYALLLREHQESWKEIQQARALARLERQQELLNTAGDPLSLARAREGVRSAQWELERLLNRLYGQKQEITLEVIGDLGDKLRRARERIIDVEVVEKTQVATQQSHGMGVVSAPALLANN